MLIFNHYFDYFLIIILIKNKHYNVELTVAKCADRAAEKLRKFLSFSEIMAPPNTAAPQAPTRPCCSQAGAGLWRLLRGPRRRWRRRRRRRRRSAAVDPAAGASS